MTGVTLETNAADLQLIKRLREAGIFEDVDPHRIKNNHQGFIVVVCGDCDQATDIHGHHSSITSRIGQLRGIHEFKLNGGALRLPLKSPLNKKGLPADKVLLRDIKDAIFLKEMQTIVIYAHFPCGAAGLCGLTVLEQLDLLVKAKRRLKKEFSEVKVACFFHVDYTNGRKRTYFISLQNWEENREKFT